MLVELLAATTEIAACRLREDHAIVLSDNSIRVRDILELPCGDGEYSDIGDLIIAALPESLETLAVARNGLADLLRRRVPGLADALPAIEEGSIVFRRSADALGDAGADAQCFAAARSIAADELLSHDSVAPARCEPGRDAIRVSYDRRHGVVRATEPLAKGDYLGRLMSLPRRGWDANQALTMSVRIGPVTVERNVRAIAPTGDASSAFVKDADGAVFSAPVASLAPSEVRHD